MLFPRIAYLCLLIIIQANMSFSLANDAKEPACSLVRIYFDQSFTFNDALKAGFEPLQHSFKECCFMEIAAGKEELSFLASKSVKIEIITHDLEKFFSARLLDKEKTLASTQSSELLPVGSMGGYYTLDEIYAIFDDLKAKYPSLISSESIGKSIQGRDIYAYCFGKCKSAEAVPSFLITALIHPREPASITSTIFFLKYLLEKYDEGDESAVYLMKNRKIVAVPVVNPDGLVFNQTIAPNGGGMRRKNMRIVNDSTFGVDLNRNFGPQEFWNASNNGSSTNPAFDTYRGSMPFSEPETEALRELARRNIFNTALGVHTFGNYLVYPYGALQQDTPDSMLFRGLGLELHSKFRYVFGTDLQTVSYSTRGGLDDYLYLSEANKPTILSATIEAGSYKDSFWPPQNRIIEIAKEQLNAFWQFAWSADVNLRPIDVFADYSQSGTEISVTVQNLGVTESEPAILKLTPLVKDITALENERAINSLQRADKQTERFSVSAAKGWENGKSVPFEVEITQQDVARIDTFHIKLITPQIIELFDGKVVDDWATDTWGIEFDDKIEEFVLSDSPGGNYKDSVENYLHYTEPIDLTAYKAAELLFDAKWIIERNYDLAGVQISSNNGESWNWLESNRTYKAIGGISGSRQTTGMNVFHGHFPWWLPQRIDLNQYVGSVVHLRFALISDRQKNMDGIYLKNIRLAVFDEISPVKPEYNQSRYGLSIIANPILKSSANPVKLTVTGLNAGDSIRIKIFDLLGGILLEKSITANGYNHSLDIDASRFPVGLHVIAVDFGNILLSQKLLIMN